MDGSVDGAEPPIDVAEAPDAARDAAVDVAIDAAGPPATLHDTGLCADPACATIAAGVRAYQPRWALWADAASKDRWIFLPPGTRIDTSDMNAWRFPVGTKLWKQFSVGTTRVETRYYTKLGPGDADWYQIAFVWNAAQTQAVAAPDGQANVLGTSHDVPSRATCTECHDRVPGRVLGFSALQLDTPSDLDLARLVAEGDLTAPPSGREPYFPMPGNATAVAALGYLHANCGHCHNPASDVFQLVPRIFRLDVTRLATVADTWTYETAVNQVPSITIPNGWYVIDPGDPTHSEMFLRFTSSDPMTRMPPIATEVIDPTGRTVLSAWITSL